MKKSILFLVLLQSLLIFAQAPQRMTYQSVVRNSANVLLANQAVGVRISILEGSLSGAAVYSETHTVTTNANGLFTLEAGGGTPTEGVFADIVWGNGAHYIKSEIDPAGGTNYTLSATKELLSVPYALYAANGITTAQADAIASQAATITALQAQITSLLPTTVLVGTQTWKAKNLNVTTYRNGDVIPEVKDGTEWTSLTTGAWCHYNNDPANDAIYGKLYNWYAVNDPRGLAPSGFHVPTDTELNAVTDMKDSAGFAGLPGGNRYSNGEFNFIGSYGIWWSSSEYDDYYAWNRRLNYDLDDAYSEAWGKRQGFSVRCVKDEDSAVNSMQAQIDAQTDAITAQASTITALQAQIVAMQAQITSLLPPPIVSPTVSVSGSSYYTYNGSAQGPTEATNSGTGTSYTFSYVGTESTIYAASSTPPTELGTYTVTATVAANGNYSSASSSATAFNIIAPITIGLHPELGGYVISVSMDGKHGIVSETQDQGMCNLNLAGILVQYPASHSAAGQQFTDWRLPTFDELTLMKNEQFKIGGFNMMELYWNCTDYLPLSFNIFGPTLESIGTGNHYVRGVRAF